MAPGGRNYLPKSDEFIATLDHEQAAVVLDVLIAILDVVGEIVMGFFTTVICLSKSV
jgi:hypothetical protein